MIIDMEKLIQVSSIGKGTGVIELELEEKAPEVVTAAGEIIFVCRYCDDVVICIGRVEKYEEVPETIESGDVYSRLKIRGRSITFSL